MYAITTMLKSNANDKTHMLWEWLNCECNLNGVQIVPFPHFSWLGCENLDIEETKNILTNFAGSTPPFFVKTTGLGVFTGSHPVLYLPVIKIRELLDAHESLWKMVYPYLEKTNIYYSPEQWMPHVTLAFRDLSGELVGCTAESLTSTQLELEISVDHIELDYYEGENLGSVMRFPFANGRGLIRAGI